MKLFALLLARNTIAAHTAVTEALVISGGGFFFQVVLGVILGITLTEWEG